jgi:superfamily I DNA/RNA helicase/RecB family exonuclease
MSDVGGPIDERRITPDRWPEAIADIPHAQIVVGGPGTGKTEFLVRRVLHLIDDEQVAPDRILVLSFGRRGVADLRERIGRGVRRSAGHIDVATFHAFAARVVESASHRRGWHTPPEVLTGPEQVGLVHELLASEQPARWSTAFRPLLSSPTFAHEVTDFILRTREQLLTGDDLARLAEARRDWRGLPRFVARYDGRLRELRRIDYGTLLAEAVWTLEGSSVDDVSTDLAHVLVDEYQDTTHAQARLLRAVSAERASLTAAADPYQSIYSFRGAALDNVATFPADYAIDGEPGRRLVLTTSFRTPAEILESAVRVTGGELPGAAGPVVPAPGRGRVDVHQFDQETEEAEWIASEVQRIHLEQGIPYRSIGVFVRSKRRFLPELSRALERRSIPHDLPDSRLADHPAVRFVLDTVLAATGNEGPTETTRAVRRLLLGAVYRTPLGRVRTLERAARTTDGGWAAVLEAADHLAPLGRLIADPSWARSQPAHDGFWELWSTVPELTQVATDPTRRDERAAWSSLSQVLARWNERNPNATLDDYRRLTEREDFEAQPLLSYRAPGEDRLLLTTLHQSKGIECDVVFVADAVEGVFPDLRARDSLLGVRHLLPHLPTDTAAYRAFRLQEERRLAYTAMTRARRRVVWTATATGFEEGRGIPSRFLALVAGVSTVADAVSRPEPWRRPVTAMEAEADLRRRLTDPGLGAPERLAALTVLTDATQPALRSPDTFAGVRVRGPDTGLLPDVLQLSPSQAEAFATCPRRYAVERWLRVGDEPTVYAEFGTLIHRVLERNEREAHARGDRCGRIARALEILDEEFDPGVFGGSPYAEAWLARGGDGLRRLYAMWPSPGAVTALEHRLTLEIGGITWRGIADRVEVDELGLKVVDYKTTKQPPSQADAASSLQLGFYVLALAADEQLSIHGAPHAAEMWFPLREQKRSVAIRQFDMEQLDAVRNGLTEASRRILAEDWTPTPSASCDRCRVRTSCPVWPQGREGFAP